MCCDDCGDFFANEGLSSVPERLESFIFEERSRSALESGRDIAQKVENPKRFLWVKGKKRVEYGERETEIIV